MPGGIWLGFDYGRARIGVAIGQSLTRRARPLKTIRAFNGEPEWQTMDKLVKEWQPRAAVIGYPLRIDGSETDISRAAKHFAEQLGERYRIATELHDERLTSKAAEQEFALAREQGLAKKNQAGGLDAVAAALILESWLQEQPV